MISKLTRTQHALLSLGILIAILGLAYLSLIAPAISSRLTFQARMDDLQFVHAKLINNIARTDNIKSTLAELQQRQPDQAGFLEEKSRALAAADLQRHINTLITTHGGELISTQVAPAASEDTLFPEIIIKIHMRAGIETFQKLLFQFKTSNPVLLIDSLQIQSRNAGRRVRRARGELDLLEIRFDLTGFIYQS